MVWRERGISAGSCALKAEVLEEDRAPAERRRDCDRWLPENAPSTQRAYGWAGDDPRALRW